MYKISLEDLKGVFEELTSKYIVISPVYEDGVIQYKENKEFDRIPFGKFQIETAGNCFISQRQSGFFTYVRPYNSIKTFLRPEEEILFRVFKKDEELTFEMLTNSKPMAFFDVRKCDLKALQILDRVFLDENFKDKHYDDLRQNIFIVAVNCIEPSNVCFCESMAVDFNKDYDADLVITELKVGFLLETKTPKGEGLIGKFNFVKANAEDVEEKYRVLSDTVAKIKRKLNTENLKEILYQKIDNEYWEILGKRCFSCMSCTKSCPTCFCFNITEKNYEEGHSDRIRVADSCFNQEFATMHKFNLRDRTSYRYRHWLLHKMAYWQDQFGTYGCVGCGRCITWCPAKIDIQVETNRLREIK